MTTFSVPTIVHKGPVEVWHSDPKFGDPKEGVFYLDSPTPAQLDKARRDKQHIWLETMESGGYFCTTPIKLFGPFDFYHPDRHDLSPGEKAGQLEYVLSAWFRKDRPETISTDEADMRRQLALRYGKVPPEPVRWDKGEPTPGVAKTVTDEFAPYIDPHDHDEQGLLPEQREVIDDGS